MLPHIVRRPTRLALSRPPRRKGEPDRTASYAARSWAASAATATGAHPTPVAAAHALRSVIGRTALGFLSLCRAGDEFAVGALVAGEAAVRAAQGHLGAQL